MGSIWGGSGMDLGGILAFVRTSGVDLEVSEVDLGWIWPSCAIPPTAKIHGKSIENLSKICRKSIEHLWKIYRKSIENLSKIYRPRIHPKFIQDPIHPNSTPNSSQTYRKSISHILKSTFSHFPPCLARLRNTIPRVASAGITK